MDEDCDIVYWTRLYSIHIYMKNIYDSIRKSNKNSVPLLAIFCIGSANLMHPFMDFQNDLVESRRIIKPIHVDSKNRNAIDVILICFSSNYSFIDPTI